MNRRPLRLSLAILAVFSSACLDDSDVPRAAVEVDAGGDGGAAVTGPVLPPGCPPLGNPLPKSLSCTGLYGEAGTGPAEKVAHQANREFLPGVQLWSDGAVKRRWVAFPEGTQVDTSNPNGWVFPEGTRFWKEFVFEGRRVETRLMYKNQGVWLFSSYKWNETETEALAVDGASVPLPSGAVHKIPTLEQCNECHRGSRDKALGFEQVLLGLPTAKGLNLAALVAEQRLSKPPARTSHVIADDGTGMASQALSWIHVNCGVSCHNETGNAQANMSRMFLRIDANALDAPTPAEWNVYKLTVGVPSVTANFFGGVRIVPGSPDKSVIVQLAETRGSNKAMPPIGTDVVDREGFAAVREWITRLGPRYPDLDAGVANDAGANDGSVADAAADASEADAGAVATEAGTVATDAGAADEGAGASSLDAGVADADQPDAALDPDAAEAPDAASPSTDGEVADALVTAPQAATP